MKFTEENYGADIDGNRGEKQIEVEIEESDAEEIVDCLYDDFISGADTGTFTVVLNNPHTDDGIEFEVELDEYLELLIEKAKGDEDLKDDEDFNAWLERVEERYRYYKEIEIRNDGQSLPTFPNKCKVCGAKTKEEIKSKSYWECKIEYECGGTYKHKSQIQNHTNKYWGNCKNGK